MNSFLNDIPPSKGSSAYAQPLSQEEKLSRLLELRQKIDGQEAPWSKCINNKVSTGVELLDQSLAGGLIPGALNELYLEGGVGALELMLPSIVGSSFGESHEWEQDRALAWIAPCPPYPPAIARLGIALERCLILPCPNEIDRLWSLEQIARSGLCDTVIAELGPVEDRLLRRLQLGATEGNTLVILLRPSTELARASPAPIRLKIKALPSSHPRRRKAHVDILRCRGEPLKPSLLMEWNIDPLAEPLHARLCHRTPHSRRSGHGSLASRTHGS